MVDFRYHLVSIVAVFLALATGIAIGATALNGGVVHNLNSQIRTLIKDKDDLRSQYTSARATSDDSDAFVKALAPSLIKDQLKNRKVVVIVLPDADKASRDQASKTLDAAGAIVSAQVRVSEKAIDADNAASIESTVALLNDGLPSGKKLTFTGADAYRHLGQLLGDVLVGRVRTTAANQQAMTTVLDGLHDAGLLDADAHPAVGGFAVLVGGQPTQTSEHRDSLTTSLSQQLATVGSGAVVVGPKAAAQAGGSIAAVRGDARTALLVSTVDNADRPAGAITLVRALVALIHGEVGQYGTGVGASSVLPSPVG